MVEDVTAVSLWPQGVVIHDELIDVENEKEMCAGWMSEMLVRLIMTLNIPV